MSSGLGDDDPWTESSRYEVFMSPASPVASTSAAPLTVSQHPLRTPSPQSNSAQGTLSPSLSRRRKGSSSALASDGPYLSDSKGEVPYPTQREPQPSASAGSDWGSLSSGIASLLSGGAASNSLAAAASQSYGNYEWEAAQRLAAKNAQRTGKVPAGKGKGRGPSEDYDREGGERKGHALAEERSGLTLDKVEGWFGISPEPPIWSVGQTGSGSRSGNATSAAKSDPSSSSKPSGGAANGTRLVLIHPVSPSDTLLSLALHYGTDVPTLRRANKLWPGDAAQMRSQIYVPVESCKWTPPNAEVRMLDEASGRLGATVEGLAFVPKEQGPALGDEAPDTATAPDAWKPPNAEDAASDFLPDTNKSYTTRVAQVKGGYPASLAPSVRPGLGSKPDSLRASSTGSAGGSTGSFAAPKGPVRVTRVSEETLSFFPPPKQKTGSEAQSNNNRMWLGPGAAGFNPGQSGLDDLLSQKRRHSRDEARAGQDGERSSSPTDSREVISPLSAHGHTRTSLSQNGSEVGTEGEEGEEWKPNKWTFGKARGASRRGLTSPAGEDANEGRSESQTTSRIERERDVVRASTGWNDAPPVSARVAQAYKTGSKRTPHHRLLQDIAAGLPANQGPASKWARPIGDCVPVPDGRAGGPPRSGARAQTLGPSNGRRQSQGWGNLINDTLRGRIPLEQALEVAWEPSSSATTQSRSRRPGLPAGLAPGVNPLPPQRPSAEEARATLGRSGGDSYDYYPAEDAALNGRSSPATSSSPALRANTDLPHELVSLETSGPAAAGSHTVGRSASKVRGSLRKVDWTATAGEG